MEKFAVIVAGGMGQRMGSAVPKQFLALHEHPVLWYTLQTFLSAYEDLQIVLAVPAGHEDAAMELIGGFAGARRITMVTGGDTRFHSVRNGLEKLGEPAADAIISVHDGVRCLVSVDLIRRCYDQAMRLGSAVPVVDCRDSVRLLDGEGGSKPIDRNRLKMVQTPQTFKAEVLIEAYRMDHQESFTDEATVVEIAGHAVHLIEGEQTNIKITTPADMVVAEELLRRWR